MTYMKESILPPKFMFFSPRFWLTSKLINAIHLLLSIVFSLSVLEREREMKWGRLCGKEEKREEKERRREEERKKFEKKYKGESLNCDSMEFVIFG